MALEKLVSDINEDLKAQRDDAIGHRESPRLIAILESLIRLTNSAEDNDALASATVDPKAAQRKALQDQIAALQKQEENL
jgi:hypothetical protein